MSVVVLFDSSNDNLLWKDEAHYVLPVRQKLGQKEAFTAAHEG